MDDLIAFVRARLDEDEAAAREAADQGRYDEWDAVGDRTDDEVGRSNWAVVGVALMETHPGAKAVAHHIARHDPARVLREVAAKRAIVEAYRQYKDAQYPDFDGGYATAMEDALKAIAAAWSDHPDYRAGWAVSGGS